MQKGEINNYLNEVENYLVNELLPFWTTRMIDYRNGGFYWMMDRAGNVIVR